MKTIETDKPDPIPAFAPKGAQVSINGLWYKIGLHGMAFCHNGIEWIKSTRPLNEVQRAVNDRNRFRKMARG